MTEREITGDIEEEGDRAVSGLDRTDGSDFRSEHGDEAAGPEGGLQEGEEWAQDRTQEGFEDGDVATT